MDLREEIEQVVQQALKDPDIAVSCESFREAIKKAMRKAALFAPDVVSRIADEIVFTEQLRHAIFQHELLRVAELNGVVDEKVAIYSVADTLFRRALTFTSKEAMREKIEQMLIEKELAEASVAKRVAKGVQLNLIIPGLADFDRPLCPVAMEEERIREKIMKMVIETMEGSCSYEKVRKQAEDFVLLLLGPPSSEKSDDSMPSLLSEIGSQLSLLDKYMDNPKKRERVIKSIEEMMAAYARPNIDTFLFVKLLNSHGKTFLSTIHSAMLNASNVTGENLALQINLQI